jgi:uncharacterized protein (TIGR00296 family)
MTTDAEGQLAVRMARATIDAYTRGQSPPAMELPASFGREGGVFVTINTYPEEELRGCIGYPSPIFPLADAVVKAAEGACEDPRFPRLTAQELDVVVVEVSVLTPPELLERKKAKDILKRVRLGTDGLIVGRGRDRGLLLPQVAVDWKWDLEEFLAQTCVKAGLLPDAWLDPDTRIWRFQSEIWAETAPRGPIVRRALTEHARP